MNNLKGSMLSKNEAFVVVDLDILLIKVTHLFVYKSYTYIYMQLFSYCSRTWYCGINTLVKLAEALQIFKSRFYCSAFVIYMKFEQKCGAQDLIFLQFNRKRLNHGIKYTELA